MENTDWLSTMKGTAASLKPTAGALPCSRAEHGVKSCLVSVFLQFADSNDINDRKSAEN